MHLMQNAETINCLVKQGEFLLKTFHVAYAKDPAGYETEFLRGDLAGWRDTLHTLYHDSAEEIVDRVLAKTCLAIPDSRSRSGITHAFLEAILPEGERLHKVSSPITSAM